MRWVVGVMSCLLILGLLTFFSGQVPSNIEPPKAPEDPTRLASRSMPDIRFTDVTEEIGVDFQHESGAEGERLLPETMGGGVTVFDYDQDGAQDLLFVGGVSWPWSGAKNRSAQPLALYRNIGARFELVDVELPDDIYAMSVAAGDMDADGWIDLYVAAVGGDRLLRNVEGKRFEDVSERIAPSPAGGWSTAAAFFDANGDGWLDIFLTRYVEWDRNTDFEVDYRIAGVGRAYGPPLNFGGTHAVLYLNQDGNDFIDHSEQSGVRVPTESDRAAVGKGLAIRPSDFDDDGDIDVLVANDTTRNFWFRNDGQGVFTEEGTEQGLAFDNSGAATGAMGADRAWLTDGTPVVAIANFANEMTSFYAKSDGVFSDEAVSLGIGPASRGVLSFGLLFMDVDLDGATDLLQINGHVEPDIERVQRSQSYRQLPQLFWQCGETCDRWFVPVESAGDLTNRKLAGRGAAYLDYDADGDLDVVVAQVGEFARVYRNDSEVDHQWMRIKLSQVGPNPNAIGARVRLATSDGMQIADVMPTRSYLSQVELPLTFGLGDSSPGLLTVRWPDGELTSHEDLPTNQEITITR